MDGKMFYGVAGGVFVVSFGVTMGVLEGMQPDFVLAKKSSYVDKKEVDHLAAAGYSAAIALVATTVVMLVSNAWKADKLHPALHVTTAVTAVFTASYTIVAITKPEFLRVEKKPELDVLKASMFSLVIAIVAGILDYVVYKQVSKSPFSAPSASCFPEMGFGKTHFKMSVPKPSCAASYD